MPAGDTSVLVIGGSGFFGERIVGRLAADPDLRLLIGARTIGPALEVAARHGLGADSVLQVDAADTSALRNLLSRHGITIVVHTAGPFQGQRYTVAEAAIAAGTHYVDLADGRAFVAGIAALDRAAKAAGVTVVSGASSVPGLSSSVVHQLAANLTSIRAIRMGISSGAAAPGPGPGTIGSIFDYCGKPIKRLVDGVSATTHGWQDLISHRFPAPVGSRLLSACDVPDMDLLPAHYPGLKTVTFHAGYANAPGHLAVWLLAGLVRTGLLPSARPLACLGHTMVRWMSPFVSNCGGMFVDVEGSAAGNQVVRSWHLTARMNHGPFVPCGGALALVERARQAALKPGAYPCFQLINVDEYLDTLTGLAIEHSGF